MRRWRPSGGPSAVHRAFHTRPAAAMKRPPRPKRAKDERVPYATPGSRLEALMQHPHLFDPPRAPRYPIVLCHGLYGFDVRGPFMGFEYHYWSAALDVLQQRLGAQVYVFAVPPTGSIQERAETLHKLLVRQHFPRGQRLNFVGHSMGGLDVRYLISHIQPQEYTPVSLTTVATPHRGSPFMDWCNENIGVGLELMDSMMREAEPKTVPDDLPTRAPFSLKSPLLTYAKTSEDRSSLRRALSHVSSSFSSYILSIFDQPAYAMLSTRYMTRLFNPTVPDQPHVRYFSIATRTKSIPIWHPLWLPKLILDKAAATGTCGADADGSYAAWHTSHTGSDGLVSVNSARWGEFLGMIENWDHWDVRGPGGPRRLRPARKPPKAPDNARTPWSRLWTLLNQWLPRSRQAKPPVLPDDPEWDWRVAALSDYEETTHKERPETPVTAAAYAMSSVYVKGADARETSKVARMLAEWISSHLPASQGTSQDDSRMLFKYLTGDQPLEGSLGHGRPDSQATSAQRMSHTLLHMFPFLAQIEARTPPPPPNDVLERFWAAVCRNLYDEGL